MGQKEVMDVLKESKTPLSRSQIAELLDSQPIKVSITLRTLLKYKDIECVELDRFQAAKVLGWKVPIRRVRFYYCEGSSNSFS